MSNTPNYPEMVLAQVLEASSVSRRDDGNDEGTFGVTVELEMRGNHRIRLRALWAGDGRPSDVRHVLDAIPNPWPSGLVVTAREFSARAIELLREREANWADQAGRAQIIDAGLVVVRDAPRLLSAAPRLTWSPSAIAIAEILLANEWPDGVRTGELARAAGWSPAQVSEVLQGFDREGWTGKFGPRRGPGSRRELLDPDGLLDAWTAEVLQQVVPKRYGHFVGGDLETFLRTNLGPVLDQKARWAATGWIGAHLSAPFATHLPSLQIYIAAEDFFFPLSDAMRDAGLGEVDEGGNVEFLSAEPVILQAGTRLNQIFLASPPRIYTDLSGLGGRAEDVGAHFRAEVIAPMHHAVRVREPSASLTTWEAASRERVLAKARAQRPDLYKYGVWTVSYQLATTSAPLSPKRLRALIEQNVGHETGWPVWNARLGTPRLVDGVIEDWYAESERFGVGSADFWRARPDGYFFLLRDYQEDGEIAGLEPGAVLDLTLPVWRVGECLLHASRMAAALSASRVEFMVRWSGLRGRTLQTVANRDRVMLPFGPAHQDTVTVAIEVRAQEIGSRLAELTRELVSPLFATFDFFEPPADLYVEETSRMRRPV